MLKRKEGNSPKRYLLLLLLMFGSFVGCQDKAYTDMTGEIEMTRLKVPNADYQSVAWLNEQTIAFISKDPDLDGNSDAAIGVFNIEMNKWEIVIPPMQLADCFTRPSSYESLSRLPDGSLGYIFFCNKVDGGHSGTLYRWDIETAEVSVLQEYPDFSPSKYTVSPDFTEIIQENAIGVGLNNELYRFSLGGDGKQIFPDFQRAAAPHWSPDGQSVIFAGTTNTPYSDPKSNHDIANLLLYPWTIYQMDADGSNVRELLTGLSSPILKWAPDGKRIAFSAEFSGKEGIWILDMETKGISRVWRKGDLFDWSPDSKRIIVLDSEIYEQNALTFVAHPTILNIDE
ncbi:MAG TPA: hypothetical protein PLD25_29960 [Chloroflexota bacterium]|nr:hypothetical protein [Chloroflexota bacterium]HUM67357.1 hypothetical protein [Chloroflexota bacterium]